MRGETLPRPLQPPRTGLNHNQPGQFSDFNRTKGTIHFTIPNFRVFVGLDQPREGDDTDNDSVIMLDDNDDEPPNPPPPPKQRRVTRSLALRMVKEKEEAENRRLAEEEARRRERELRQLDLTHGQMVSAPIYLRGMQWRIDVRHCNEQIQV